MIKEDRKKLLFSHISTSCEVAKLRIFWVTIWTIINSIRNRCLYISYFHLGVTSYNLFHSLLLSYHWYSEFRYSNSSKLMSFVILGSVIGFIIYTYVSHVIVLRRLAATRKQSQLRELIHKSVVWVEFVIIIASAVRNDVFVDLNYFHFFPILTYSFHTDRYGIFLTTLLIFDKILSPQKFYANNHFLGFWFGLKSVYGTKYFFE